MNSIFIGLNVVKRTLHDVSSINFLIIFPILAGIIVIIMLGNGDALELGIANVQQDVFGLIEYLDKNEQYSIDAYNEMDIEKAIEDGAIKAGLMFSESGKIKLIASKSDARILELKGSIEMYMTSINSGEEIKLEEANDNNKTEKSKRALGMMTMFMIVFAGNNIAILLDDKRLKTFTRTFCAPVNGYEAVLGYLMASMLLGIVQIVVFLVFTTYIFGIEWGIPIAYVFTLMIIYMIGAIGLAIGFTGFITESEKYNMVLMLTGVATSFLGGSFFPVENMNVFIQRISNFTPQKWLMEAFNKLVNGGSMGDIQINILILLMFGGVLFTFGVKTLKPNPEDL